MTAKTLVIDVSYLIYRSFFAYPQLTSNNQPIGAFFGFAKTVLVLNKQFLPDLIVFANDLPQPTWRHQQLDSYKAGRPQIDAKMLSQIPLIQNWCQKISLNYFAIAGFEADDIIATVAGSQVDSDQSQNYPIFSSDRDLYQLLQNEKVQIIQSNNFGQVTLFGKTEFIDKYQLQPWQWLDYKALVGDTSDNLKGVTGVGAKTATRILQQIGSLKWFFESLGLENKLQSNDDLQMSSFVEEFLPGLRQFIISDKNQTLIQKLVDNQKQIEQTRFLVTLQTLPDLQLKQVSADFLLGLEDFYNFNFTSLIKNFDLSGKNLTASKQQSSTEALF